MALKNLIMMATGVVEAAKTSRDTAINVAKTAVLNEVKTTTVNEAIKENLNGVEITGLATKTEVSAVNSQVNQNTADIGNIEQEIGVLTTNVQKKIDADKVYTKEEVDSKIAAVPKFGVEVVDTLPAVTDAAADKVYLVRTSDLLGSNNIFTEYILVNGIFEQLGTQELDLSNYATLDDLAKYVLKSDIFTNGYFKTVYNHQDGSYAMMWNESDGGGSQYFNKNADVISYVGTNDGGADASAITVQIYSKNKTSNSGVRLNVNSQKAYYTKGANATANGGTEDNEIAVKGDITNALIGKANTTDVYTKIEVDNAVNAKADADQVYTKAEVDQKINDAIAEVLEQIQNEMNQ